MKKPFFIIIDGPMGAGKTTTAKLLHSKMKRTALISLDGVKRLLSDYKRGNSEQLMLAHLVGSAMIKTYLKNGYNVILEKALTKDEYVRATAKIGKNISKVLIYQIEAPLEIRIKRVLERPLPEGLHIKTPPSRAKILRNHKHYTDFKYKKAKVFDSSKMSTSQIVNRILKDLKNI